MALNLNLSSAPTAGLATLWTKNVPNSKIDSKFKTPKFQRTDYYYLFERNRFHKGLQVRTSYSILSKLLKLLVFKNTKRAAIL